MALLRSPSTCPLSPVQFHRNSVLFPKPFTSTPLVSKIPICLISETSGSASPNFLNPNPFLQRLRCCTSSISPTEPDSFPSNIIFVKGLPQSTSEGTLKTMFSHFGEVSRVKILTDKKNKQPLGFAYLWFSSEESAQMAVKEMNGKLFDGRFVSVTIVKPGSCKTNLRATPYEL